MKPPATLQKVTAKRFESWFVALDWN